MSDAVFEKLPNDITTALRARANAHGRSVEEELSTALREALTGIGVTPLRPKKTREELEEVLKGVEARLLKGNGGRMPKGVVDAFIAERRIETLQEEIEHFRSVADKADPP
jgi:hypothetical protein